MKVVLDMNLSPSWVESFEEAGFEAVHWTSVGHERATDRQIFDWARANDRVVFTHDLDFSHLLALSGESGPSVVQLRTHEVLPDRSAAMVIDVFRSHEKALRAGAIVVIDPGTSRVRLLPL